MMYRSISGQPHIQNQVNTPRTYYTGFHGTPRWMPPPSPPHQTNTINPNMRGGIVGKGINTYGSPPPSGTQIATSGLTRTIRTGGGVSTSTSSTSSSVGSGLFSGTPVFTGGVTGFLAKLIADLAVLFGG